jgi:hypothetical protein
VTKRTLLLALFVLVRDPRRSPRATRTGTATAIAPASSACSSVTPIVCTSTPRRSERIRAMAAASRDQAQPLRDQAHRLHDEMRSSALERFARVGRRAREGRRDRARRDELQKQRLRTMLEIRALLTPEQRRELVKIHEEMRAERGDRPARRLLARTRARASNVGGRRAACSTIA